MHAQDMQDAAAHRKRDEIQMIQDVHPGNPFADGGRTLALMGRDTSPSAELLQLAMQTQYPSYPYDGSDLLALPPPPPPPPPPAIFDFKGTSDDKLDAMIAKHIAEKQARKAARDAAKTTKVRSKYGTTTYPATPVTGDKRTNPRTIFTTDQSRPKRQKTKTAPAAEQDTTQYIKPRKVPGQTSDEKIDHLVRQRLAGVGQLPSENTNPVAGVFLMTSGVKKISTM
jgi:hypothetical protein